MILLNDFFYNTFKLRSTRNCERMPLVSCYFRNLNKHIISTLEVKILRASNYEMGHLKLKILINIKINKDFFQNLN